MAELGAIARVCDAVDALNPAGVETRVEGHNGAIQVTAVVRAACRCPVFAHVMIDEQACATMPTRWIAFELEELWRFLADDARKHNEEDARRAHA